MHASAVLRRQCECLSAKVQSMLVYGACVNMRLSKYAIALSVVI